MTHPAKPRPSLRELSAAKPDVSQSGARKLTAADKATVRDSAVRREMERHPNVKIPITVRGEVDGDGNARYTALVLAEEVAEGVIGCTLCCGRTQSIAMSSRWHTQLRRCATGGTSVSARERTFWAAPDAGRRAGTAGHSDAGLSQSFVEPQACPEE